MKNVLLIAFAVVVLVGCDGAKFEEATAKADGYTIVTVDSINKAEPVIDALEGAVPGYEGINAEEKARIVKIADGVSRGANVLVVPAKALAATGNPWAIGAANILGIIGTAAGAVGAFVQRRKAKKHGDAAKSVMAAVDELTGIGKIINQQAHADKTADTVAKLYGEMAL